MPSALAALALDVFASVLAPPRCAACDAPVGRLAAFCPSCAATVEAGKDGEDALAAFAYGGAIAQAITRMKYESRPDLARPLGDLLWRALAVHGSPGPRGAPNVRRCESGAVRRDVRPAERHTPKQASLDRDTRLANVAGAFRVREPTRVQGRAVLLVDDVSTTGATLDACSRALRTAGARTVATAVLAKA